ncbi:hypothetical protein N7488_012275 [Penicillium malachiteum]|nr:hypothetical protein N7488_012275 [Penicillium malachiteum]
MRGVICQNTTSEEPNTPVFEASELPIEEDIPRLSTPDISNIFQPQLCQSIFDPNIFDTFFSDLGPCSSVLPSNFVMPSSENMNGQEVTWNKNRCISPERESSDRTSFSQLQTHPELGPAALANHSMEFIFQVLRTWPRMLAEEFQLPPIFHVTHFAQYEALPRPLATCVTLAKMWNGQCAGAEEMVRSTILTELDLIVHSPKDLDESMLVAVLQAVLIYSIILLSPSDNLQSPATDDHIVFRKVEALVYQVVRGGLFLNEERSQTRPRWED